MSFLGLRAPVTGMVFHGDALYVSEGGKPARISRVDPGCGSRTTILDDLPSGGDYHANTPLVINDWLYFGQGAATNSGVVSEDLVTMPWAKGKDLAHDLPGREIEVSDAVARTICGDGNCMRTGGFQQFGNAVPSGTRLAAQLPCTSAVMRCRLDGSDLELVAWGLRNPYGLGLLSDGRMMAN